MRIFGLWITRVSEPDGLPELLVAWDEHSVFDNEDGWLDARRRAVEAVGNDMATRALISIDVDDGDLLRLLRPEARIRGTLLPDETVYGVQASRV